MGYTEAGTGWIWHMGLGLGHRFTMQELRKESKSDPIHQKLTLNTKYSIIII
jgi:hypothetical protein